MSFSRTGCLLLVMSGVPACAATITASRITCPDELKGHKFQEIGVSTVLPDGTLNPEMPLADSTTTDAWDVDGRGMPTPPTILLVCTYKGGVAPVTVQIPPAMTRCEISDRKGRQIRCR